MALDSLKEGLRDPSTAFVYHCLNHYFCPVGYEEIPKNATDAYKWVCVMYNSGLTLKYSDSVFIQHLIYMSISKVGISTKWLYCPDGYAI